jgi:hypothetical protein
LAAANPDSYKALLTAWDARVKATMAVGAIDALAMALETGGTSLAAYGLSLGTGLGLDYLADFVVKHGAEKAATLASDGNPRLYESYQKTFNYVGAMVAQHGIRAGLKKITSSSRSSSSSSSSTSSSAAAPRQTKSTILQTRDYSTSFNTALKQKTHLAFEEAGVLTRDGRLTPKALGKSSHIPLEGGIKNKIIKETLTADGSQISDWGKYKTQSVTLPTGESRQIHFYMNKKTGKVDYETVDFKISRDVSLGEGLE